MMLYKTLGKLNSCFQGRVAEEEPTEIQHMHCDAAITAGIDKRNNSLQHEIC